MSADRSSGGPLAARLDAAIGTRVALRHRLPDGLLTDAVGELSAAGPDAVAVDTRKGPVRVHREAVVAVRTVPPAPPRRAPLTAVARLENLAADAWPALVDAPLGAWRLRAAEGFSGRANSALALGDPGLPTPAALDRVREFAATHGLRPRVQVPVGTPWSAAVEREGWVLDRGHQAGAEVAVLVTNLTALGGPDAAVTDTTVTEIADAPSAGWWLLGGSDEPGARHVLTAAPATTFALARIDGVPAGVLRGTVVEDHLHLSRLEVRPEFRRRGVASALTAAVAARARERGARWGLLQVALHNAGARALYARTGWREHHRYHYLVPPGS